MANINERAELHKTIWQIANDLRGSVDGWDFKNYVLGFLFYRFISEDLAAHLKAFEAEAGNEEFDYSTIDDDDVDDDARNQTISEKGYFIYPSELFKNVAARAENDDNLNETLARIFKNIEGSAMGTDSEDDMKGLFSDIDVNSPKLGATVSKRNELLTKLMQKIGAMNLGGDLQDARIDAFGDAYEFLMTMYASNAGKSGGEFFTPQEVAELLARIACTSKSRISRVYDPACGSGSLLLKFVKVLGPEKAKMVSFFGQEINITTYNLCRINMFLHHVPFDKFDIQLGDTLTDPKHLADQPFDAIVSNPPYSTHWAGDSNPLLINDDRYSPAGVLAPKTKADLAFTMHMLHHLSTTGIAAIVEFPGVLYRGGAEQKIRQYLVENNFVDCVIQLPENLFFGVSIATCIIVLKKSKADNNVLFIDASANFVKDGNKNKLTDDNIKDIFNTYVERIDVEYKSRLVNNKEIIANDSNLSISNYIEQKDTREIINIDYVNGEINRLLTEEKEINDTIERLINEHVERNVAELKELGEFGKFENIGTDKKTIEGEQIVTLLNYVDVYHNKHIDSSVPQMKVSASDKKVKDCTVEKGDIFVTPSSETVDDIGHSSVIEETISNAVYSYHIMRYRLFVKNYILSQYINYAFDTDSVKKQIMKKAQGLTRFGLSKDKFASIQIPVPSSSEQQRIVSILDQFEASIANLKAQLAQREKQYEYYRNKLLTFE